MCMYIILQYCGDPNNEEISLDAEYEYDETT
jgi:hypothetical protein